MTRSAPSTPGQPDETMGSVIAEVERAMVRIRRSMTRRTLGKRLNQELGTPVDLGLLAVVDAVEQGPDDAEGGVTVGAVAERLGIDPSRASRLVGATIKAGYIRRIASQSDGRRIHLELTPLGQSLVNRAHQTRQAVFEAAMQDWPERDRREFARLITRFVDALGTISHTEGSP